MKCYIAEENKSLIKSPPAFNWGETNYYSMI
jgi:hypothetical protein